MIITQTIDVPADRRVFFEFFAPKDIPTGRAHVEVKVIPDIRKNDKPLQKNAGERSTPHTDALLSIFSSMGDVSLDEIRTERLARHLK